MDRPSFSTDTRFRAGVPVMPALNWRTLSGALYSETSRGHARFHVAGIVNVTPDSFYDGGHSLSVRAAVDRALGLLGQGAGIVDFGAESTRPGAAEISATEEMSRLFPVVELFRAEISRAGERPCAGSCPGPYIPQDPCISVDTYRAATAKKLLESGFTGVINDISGGTLDTAMDAVICEHRPGYVLGHCPAPPREMQRNPRYTEVVEDLLAYFESRMNALVARGLPEEAIALDPCIGFGKSTAHNLALIREAWRFHALGRPLYYGISRKSFLAGFLPPGADRGHLTQVATALLAERGVQLHRVHDVADTVATLALVSNCKNS